MSSTTKDVTGLQKKFQSIIDEIMDNFDFHKVHKVMKCLGWKWAFSENGIPEIYELKEEARRLLNECLYSIIQNAEESWNIATGGFKVHATNYKDAEVEDDEFHIGLSLSFEVEEWNAY